MRDTISISTKVVFRKWPAPNFATVSLPPLPRQEGMKELPSVPIAELQPQVLDALAEAWLADLYAKANRKAPELRFA